MEKTYATMDNVQVSWAVSRGRDTYGYNICRADSYVMGQRFKCIGGGYDMIGTVIGQYIQERFEDQLKALVKAHESELTPYVSDWFQLSSFYGLTFKPSENRVSLDGGCGIESMLKIAAALGLEVERTHNRKGHTNGYIFCEVAA
jgi:hypothetical protein